MAIWYMASAPQLFHIFTYATIIASLNTRLLKSRKEKNIVFKLVSLSQRLKPYCEILSSAG